jgi:hypothetical protein
MADVAFGLQGPDGNKSERRVDVHRNGGHNGLVTFTRPDELFNPSPLFFINDTHGIDMAQNVSFGGTPEIIHNGGTSTEWTGSAVAGTWNFADAGKISITSANDLDEATFAEESPTTIDTSGYTALTGEVNLTTYNQANNGMTIRFDNAGTQVGVDVDLESYVDASLIGSAQTFAIPLSAFFFASDDVDGFSIIMTRLGGAKPTVVFDDIQLEETGDPLEFKITKDTSYDYYADQIKFLIADNVTSVVTNGTVPGLSYNTILGVSALANGITFKRVIDGQVDFSTPLRQLSDFLRFGNVTNPISDGTNTYINIEVNFQSPVIISGNPDDNYISLTIADDLSGLLLFNAIIRGSDKYF